MANRVLKAEAQTRGRQPGLASRAASALQGQEIARMHRTGEFILISTGKPVPQGSQADILIYPEGGISLDQ